MYGLCHVHKSAPNGFNGMRLHWRNSHPGEEMPSREDFEWVAENEVPAGYSVATSKAKKIMHRPAPVQPSKDFDDMTDEELNEPEPAKVAAPRPVAAPRAVVPPAPEPARLKSQDEIDLEMQIETLAKVLDGLGVAPRERNIVLTGFQNIPTIRRDPQSIQWWLHQQLPARFRSSIGLIMDELQAVQAAQESSFPYSRSRSGFTEPQPWSPYGGGGRGPESGGYQPGYGNPYGQPPMNPMQEQRINGLENSLKQMMDLIQQEREERKRQDEERRRQEEAKLQEERIQAIQAQAQEQVAILQQEMAGLREALVAREDTKQTEAVAAEKNSLIARLDALGAQLQQTKEDTLLNALKSRDQELEVLREEIRSVRETARPVGRTPEDLAVDLAPTLLTSAHKFGSDIKQELQGIREAVSKTGINIPSMGGNSKKAEGASENGAPTGGYTAEAKDLVQKLKEIPELASERVIETIETKEEDDDGDLDGVR